MSYVERRNFMPGEHSKKILQFEAGVADGEERGRRNLRRIHGGAREGPSDILPNAESRGKAMKGEQVVPSCLRELPSANRIANPVLTYNWMLVKLCFGTAVERPLSVSAKLKLPFSRTPEWLGRSLPRRAPLQRVHECDSPAL